MTLARKAAICAGVGAAFVYVWKTWVIYQNFVAHQPTFPRRPDNDITGFAPQAAFFVSLYYAIPAFLLIFAVVAVVLLVFNRVSTTST